MQLVDRFVRTLRWSGLFLPLLAIACGEKEPDPTPGTAGTGTGGSAGTGATAGSGGTAASGGSAGTAAGAGSPGAGTGGSAGSSAAGGTAGTGGLAGSGTSGAGNGGAAGGMAGAGGSAAPMWGIETRPTGQTCLPPASMSAQPALLSATGCVDPMNPTRPAATLLPYGVASPLWSDAAEKARFVALPDGGTIHVRNCTTTPDECLAPEQGGTGQSDGDWDFPIGTVFMKTFAFEGKLIETRLLVRKGEFDWWGFSYQWRDDQSDADLLAANGDGYHAMVQGPNGMQDWHFPSRSQCLQCHTTAMGVAIGPETGQLDYEYTYPNGLTQNQLEVLSHIGVFDSAPVEQAALPDPADETVPLEARARSYLHSNCAMCHRPGANYTGFDTRYETPFAETMLCGVAPDKGDLGVTGALRISPGNPEQSVVSLRMHTLDPLYRMPMIGSGVVDPGGTALIDEWITSLTACP